MKDAKRWPALALAVLVGMAGCARQHEAGGEMSAAAPAEAVADLPMAAPPAAEAAKAADAGVLGAGVDAGSMLASRTGASDDPRRRFVRTAQATFQVKDVYASALAIEDVAAAEGGFVTRNAIGTQQVRELERPVGDGKLLRLSEVVTEGSLEVRVPGDRAQGFLRKIASQMQFLDARTYEARDVQFDLLRQQLAWQRSQDVQRDIAATGAQPGRTGDKVDAAQARGEQLAVRDEAVVAQRELEDRIAYATLTLTLRQPAQVREQVVPDTAAILRERGPGFFAQAGEAIASGWRGLLAAAVLAVGLWPLWLGAAAAWFAATRLRRWRRARRPQEPPPVAGESGASRPV